MSKNFVSFDPGIAKNNYLFWHYYNRLLNIATSLFTWENLPDGIDERYLEYTLITTGSAAIGYDPLFETNINSGFYCCQVDLGGRLNIYNTPYSYRGVTVTRFSPKLNQDNSVLIYNNYTRTPDAMDISMYASRLTNIIATIDVNVIAQKTPTLLTGPNKLRLSMVNIVDKIMKNLPYIQVDSKFNLDSIKALKIDAPYVADKLTTLKKEILSEYYNFLGIDNFFSTKNERNVTGEIDSNSVSIQAEGQSRLKARQQACDVFNRLFAEQMGLEKISVHYAYETIRSQTKMLNSEGGAENVNLYNEGENDM